ncbi:rhodanese-like domain-containing protein [Sphingosinicella terrae]|uniref:rhodanese-like domain-containing protein n=1 Tax=Sphingosinicella terrae TaxID=2172047 RepID=UPI000E0D5CE9|nr:rhodanese-like domain-containing protein [Sphingosinicella terrae]
MLRPILFLSIAVASAQVEAAAPVNPQIDYATFRHLTAEVEPYRQERLIDWEAFVVAAGEPGVLILDARSERQFAAGHIDGAVNLPLPEFSVERLAEVIGEVNRPILIYCNNNFDDDRPPVMLKSGPVALNIPTFIHLYAYGYRNIRELGEVVDLDDPRIPWVTDTGGSRPSRADRPEPAAARGARNR